MLVLKGERKREWAEQLHKGCRHSNGQMDGWTERRAGEELLRGGGVMARYSVSGVVILLQ